MGPAPLIQNGHAVPDAYRPGTAQDGGGSIVLSARRTTTNDTLNQLTNAGFAGGFQPNARIQTSNIKTNVNSEIWGAPFEIYPGKTVNLHAGGSAKVHGSILRISAGTGIADNVTGISYGGNLLLRGGYGRYGGYTELKGGSGITNGGAVYIDAGSHLTGTHTGIVIGEDGIGNASGSDVNVYGTNVSVTGQVSMVSAPAMCPLLAAFGHTATSGGVYTLTSIQPTSPTPLGTWETIVSAVQYDRFINITMQLPGGGSSWKYVSTSFSVNAGALTVARCTCIFNNTSVGQNGSAWGGTSFYVPAGSALSMSFDAISNGAPINDLYIEVVSTKLGK